MSRISKFVGDWINKQQVYTKAYSGIPPDFFNLWERKYELKQVAVGIAQLAARGRLLDIGTGPGFLPLELAKNCPNLNTIGIDIEFRLLKEATIYAKKNRLAERFDCIIAQAEYLPFADCSFDIVTSTYSLHLWNDKQQGIKEMHRILKPRGTAMLLVGRRWLLHGWQYITDWFTKGTISAIRTYCINAGFEEQNIEIQNMSLILRITVTK